MQTCYRCDKKVERLYGESSGVYNTGSKLPRYDLGDRPSGGNPGSCKDCYRQAKLADLDFLTKTIPDQLRNYGRPLVTEDELRDRWLSKLLKEGIISKAEMRLWRKKFSVRLKEAYTLMQSAEYKGMFEAPPKVGLWTRVATLFRR